MYLKDLWLNGNEILQDLLDQLGGLDSSGCALDAIKF
ncbi:unnamed protein product, partial [marine sediment metagenome]